MNVKFQRGSSINHSHKLYNYNYNLRKSNKQETNIFNVNGVARCINNANAVCGGAAVASGANWLVAGMCVSLSGVFDVMVVVAVVVCGGG